MRTSSLLSLAAFLAIPLASVTALAGSPDCVEIPVDEGSFTCERPSDTPSLFRKGPMTWQYVGQAVFGDGQAAFAAADRLGERLERRDADHLARPGVADFRETLRVDRAGRQWIVASVDWDTLGAAVDAYDESLPAAEVVDPYEPFVADPPKVGEYDVPLSWADGTCSGGDIVWATWNGDDRNKLTNANLTARQKTVVQSVSGTGSIGCTGTIVGDTWILTAAHCVTGPSGGAHNPANTTVTAGSGGYGNFEQFGADAIVLDGPPWNGNVSTDYALIELDDDIEDTNGKMFLSTASNSTVTGNPLHNLGYPAVDNPASSCGGTSKMHHLIEDAKSVTTKQVRTYHDSTSGHSGGPVFYCPTGADDVCAAGDSGYVISVMTAIHYNTWGNANDVRGPRVKDFRTWALGQM